MSGKLFIDNQKRALRKQKRRRNKSWAMPLVMSLTMTPLACTKASTTGTPNETHNPPAPIRDASVAPEPLQDAATTTTSSQDANTAVTPPPRRNPPSPRSLPKVPKGSKGNLVVRDGRCFWNYEPSCSPKKPCNPPPPMRVQCPQDIPSPNGRIVSRADGCYFRFTVKCPPNAKCNPPPPPRKVACPGDDNPPPRR